MSARCLAGVLIVLLLASTGWAVPPLPTVTHDGRSYVELTRVAASIKAKGTAPAKVVTTAASTEAELRAGGKVVTLTRNWSRVLVNGKPVVLDAPVRVKGGVWLVPESFMGRVVPTLVASAPPGPPPARVAAAPVEVGLRGGPGQIVSVVHPHRRRDVVGRGAPHRVERAQGSARADRGARQRLARAGDRGRAHRRRAPGSRGRRR